MKKITLHPDSNGAKIIKSVIEKKKQREKEIQDKMPPCEVLTMINNKTDEVYDLNKGNLDKKSFKLGMLCMWHEQNRKP